MKTNKIEVAKIDINIGEKTISLKPEQAKALKKILNEMFEETTDKSVHHYWWNYPWHTNPYPYWTITYGGGCGTSAGLVNDSLTFGSSYTYLSNNMGDISLCLNE